MGTITDYLTLAMMAAFLFACLGWAYSYIANNLTEYPDDFNEEDMGHWTSEMRNKTLEDRQKES